MFFSRGLGEAKLGRGASPQQGGEHSLATPFLGDFVEGDNVFLRFAFQDWVPLVG